MKILFAPFLAVIAIFFDPGSQPVTNRVLSREFSVPIERYQGRTNVLLIEVSDYPFPPGPPASWKNSNGVIVSLSAAELAAISNFNAAANIVSKQDAARSILTNKEFEVYSRALYHSVRKFWGTNVAQGAFLLDLRSNVLNFIPQDITE